MPICILDVLQCLVKPAFEHGDGVIGEQNLSLIAFEVYEYLSGSDPLSGLEPGGEVYEAWGIEWPSLRH